MDKHTIELQVKPQNIVESPLEDIMGDRYGVYAKYVIQDRAIPDVRDGLKPVQRRIIFSMYQDHNVFSKPTRKCAHTVGAVMGKFHPHGDSSIYNALARMAQDWKVRLPLIDFQGNKGSIDGDAPAAYRYTEARLSEAAEEMIKDLEKDTVDMQLTFDDTQFEPVVLPSRFPNLLVNGTEGIAVAIATNIPPHNLVEVCEAVIYKIQHKRATLDELLEIIKGPDFPTGGIIYRGEGLRSMYEKGQGRVEVIAKSHIETDKKNINQIVITEIPYDVIKLDIVKEIDVIRVEKVIDGIIEVRDESDRNGLRIVIDVRKDANIDLIKTYLYNKTLLKSSFSANMVAIVDNRPKTFTLMEYLDAYISHQVDVITRRSKFDLEKFKARLHIVDGLIHAISIVDQVVKTIRHSSDKAEAKLNIQREYGFTEIQSEAIVTLQLYKLSNTDISIFVEEKKKLEADIERLNAILEDPAKLDRVIVSDLKDIIKKYGTERLTAIEDKVEFKPIDKRDLISKEEVVFAVTRDGYIKRSSIKSFKSSDSDLPGLKEGDVLVGKGNILTTDFLLLFTNKGNFCYVPVNEIQDNKWKDEGKYISYICALPAEEKIIKAIGIRNFRNDLYIALVTKNGQIKRTNLSEFELNRYSKPVTCMKLLQGDEIADVGVTSGNSNICLVTEEGGAAFYNENQVSKCGLRAAGVKAISNLKLGKIVNMLIYHPDDKNKVFL
ncbi:MAG: DNA topoisomerase IV subunit A, partial [Bacilli bacterium]|nr:DNA topoisomerase IV subunit A [Bacilli bacterium]